MLSGGDAGVAEGSLLAVDPLGWVQVGRSVDHAGRSSRGRRSCGGDSGTAGSGCRARSGRRRSRRRRGAVRTIRVVVSQPGKLQPPSRAIRATVWPGRGAAGGSGRGRRTTPSGLRTARYDVGLVGEPARPRRPTAGCRRWSRPCRARARRSASVMVTITVAGVPPESGSVPERSSRSQTSSRASWVRWPWWRGSGSSTTPAVVEGDLLDPRRGQRAEDGVELGAELPVSRPSTAYMPSRVLRNARWRRSEFSCRAGPCRRGRSVRRPAGRGPQLASARTRGEPGEQPRRRCRGRRGRTRAGPPPRSRGRTRRPAPGCSPARCAAASAGRSGASGSPVIVTRSPSCSAARTRRAASPRESRSAWRAPRPGSAGSRCRPAAASRRPAPPGGPPATCGCGPARSAAGTPPARSRDRRDPVLDHPIRWSSAPAKRRARGRTAVASPPSISMASIYGTP